MTFKTILLKEIFDIYLICFILSFNVFFAIFVWNTNDLSPNFAIGLVSLLFIIGLIIRFKEEQKERKVGGRRTK